MQRVITRRCLLSSTPTFLVSSSVTTRTSTRTVVSPRFLVSGSIRSTTSSSASTTSTSSTTNETIMSRHPKWTAPHLALANKATSFLTASTDPFHAVHHSIERLKAAGFQGLSSSQPLTGKIQPGGKYYYTVEASTLVAFAVGPKCGGSGSGSNTDRPEPFGFHMIGGHTDSPNLKLKPRSKRSGGSSGCTQLGVECYGGGLWHTWFDRDLSVSGRVFLQKKSDGHKIQQRLVQLTDPIARISTLCIHLQSAEERKGFAVNKETHTAPIIATTTPPAPIQNIVSDANQQAKTALEQGAEAQINDSMTSSWREGQEPLLLQAIADQLQVEVDEIVDFELNLYDTQPAALGGISQDFLYSARLDNLATVFCATEAICEYAETMPSDAADVSVMVCFDHEEVGSTSAQGAGSPVMKEAVERIAAALMNGNGNGTTTTTTNNNNNNNNAMSPDLYASCIRKSFILSIDQAHAIHPNYANKHEPVHAPELNAGVVIKTNSNQRYATNGITGFVVRALGRQAGIPIQEFVVRNDCPCGSTIGPTVSALTGIRTVDIGMPQLSMHSCREVMGVADLTHGKELFKTFFTSFRELDNNLSKDIEP